ncbi:hypothetical protein AAC03nite_28060 [Alicyclobacillus acidoterrestris]|nr:hypothetical protein AAC03nite_28060 [Alicyclobacillus acidoterrestris]
MGTSDVDKVIRTAKVKHVNGLEVGETVCELVLFSDRLIIRNDFTNLELSIPLSSIYLAGLASQIIDEQGFSIGGAFLGDLIAGPLGAVIGGIGAGHKKGSKNILIIRYLDDGEKQLIFRNTPFHQPSLELMARALRKRAKQNVKLK